MELIEQLSKLAKFRKFHMFFPRFPENGLPSQTTQAAKNMEKRNLPQKCFQTKTHVMATTELTTKGQEKRATTDRYDHLLGEIARKLLATVVLNCDSEFLATVITSKAIESLTPERRQRTHRYSKMYD
jgi:DNA-binding MarR family transcriptional regulator